jgi:cytochrome b subunit of formate dehydrogenase
MFYTISIIGFVVTFLGIGICCLAFPCCKQCQWAPLAILRRVVRILTMLPLEQKLSPVGALRKLVYLLALLCFLILAVTAFYPVLVLKEPIHGYWLILHATFAPVFVICLAGLAVMWAGNCCFNKNDWPPLQRVLGRESANKVDANELLRKICFWLIILLALPLILSIILSMFQLFGTYWQELLLNIHRYVALVFAVVAIVHTYLIIRTQMDK